MTSFDKARDAAVVMDQLDPVLGKRLRTATTPESMLPIIRQCLSKVGRKSRFDKRLVDQQEWDVLVECLIVCLEENLEIAKRMKGN